MTDDRKSDDDLTALTHQILALFEDMEGGAIMTILVHVAASILEDMTPEETWPAACQQLALETLRVTKRFHKEVQEHEQQEIRH